jgi:hypothetical protein
MKFRFVIVAVLFGCTRLSAAGLCLTGEETYFSCEIRGSRKNVSVCGGTGWLQYRFGTTNHIELTFPSEREGSLRRFQGASRIHKAADVAAEFLMFQRGGIEYSVTAMNGGSEFNGVSVLVPGAKTTKDLHCDMRKDHVRNLSEAIQLVPEGNP